MDLPSSVTRCFISGSKHPRRDCKSIDRKASEKKVTNYMASAHYRVKDVEVRKGFPVQVCDPLEKNQRQSFSKK